MLHNAVVLLYRRTITFSYTVPTNHKSRLRIPTCRWERGERPGLPPKLDDASAPGCVPVFTTSARAGIGFDKTPNYSTPPLFGNVNGTIPPGLSLNIVNDFAAVRRCRLNTSA